MKKRITSVWLCLAMLVTVLASTAVPTRATETCTLTLTADKTTASTGDTIAYTLTMGPVTNMCNLAGKLVIPSGLTFVNYEIPENLSSTLGIDVDDGDEEPSFSKTNLRFTTEYANDGYISEGDTTLLTFTCTVNGEQGGKRSVSFNVETFFEADDDFTNIPYTFVPATVDVTIPATGVTLNKSTLSLVENHNETLTATVAPPAATNKTVAWTSSDEKVATVDSDGKVTAKNAGTATITATVGEYTATCTVTVTCNHSLLKEVSAQDSTCTTQGWDAYKKCSKGGCGALFDTAGNAIDAIPLRALAAHDYTEKTVNKSTMIHAATCTEPATYYYSCSVCGAVSTTGTFTDGDALGHDWANKYTTNDAYHWKKCNRAGCDVVDGKAQHSSTGNNVATCTTRAVCDTCGEKYGAPNGHSSNGKYQHNDTYHWFGCTNCTGMVDPAEHTYDQEVATDNTRATDATCTKPATYYKTCVCGAKGTETFESGGCNPHSYHQIATEDHKVTAATCQKQATYRYSCSVCGVEDMTSTAIFGAGAYADHNYTATNTEQSNQASPATCTKPATYYKTCVCGAKGTETFESGELAAHDYSATTVDDKYLTIPATCQTVGRYYYSCTVCGESEKDKNHLFWGYSLDPSNHEKIEFQGASEPDHKNQIPGQTGQKMCTACSTTLESSQPIYPSPHVPSDSWSSDGTNHWKICTVDDCGVAIESTKTAHSSTGDNVATCEKQAVCDICGASYGDALGHSWSDKYSSDDNRHWHACTNSGCDETEDNELHDYTCNAEGEEFLKTAATCKDAAEYYYSCVCGAKGTETFESGDALGHSWAATYSSDATGHWYACTNSGCSEKVGVAAHTPDHEGSATKDYAIKCSVCGYVIEAQKSSSGGSSSSSTKTETTKNADGSTTTTTTAKDGTTTETTTAKDGTKTVVESKTSTDSKGNTTETTTETVTAKDGSKSEVKTETVTTQDGATTSKEVAKVTDAAGSTATTTTETNAAGKTTVKAEASVSSKAIETAQKENKAVTVPVEVKATTDSESAPLVSVSIPKSAGEVEIEIPVSNASSGTVAVLVNADGTEEILKNTLPTENGVALKVSGDVTVKLVDNSESFTDTVNHWSKNEVDFVAARKIFNGVGNHLFGVSAPMTRGMVNTVLARLSGADTEGGAHWYDKGTEWAMAHGISDGTNPTGNVTREQFATMLYRYAGSPEVHGTLSFTDAASVSGYAQDAVLWASQVGILSGFGDGSVAPAAGAERAQVAAMLARYIKLAG